MNLGQYQFELSSLVQQKIELKEGDNIDLRVDELKLRNKFIFMIRYEDIARFNCFDEEQLIGELMKLRILNVKAVITKNISKLEIHSKIPILLQIAYQDTTERVYDQLVKLMRLLKAQQIPTMFNLFIEPDYKIPPLIKQIQEEVQPLEIIGIQSQLYKFQQICINWMILRERQKKMYIPPFVRQYKLNGQDLFLNFYTGVLNNQIPLRYLKNGGILADETGLGKKLQMLSLIIHSNKSSLIITQSDVKLNKWLLQLQQHFKGFEDFITVADTTIQQYKMLTFITKENLFRQRDIKQRSNVYKQNWYRVVFDNPESMYSKMFINGARLIQREITWCITHYDFKNYDKYLQLLDQDIFDQCPNLKTTLIKQYKVVNETINKVEKLFIDSLTIQRSYQDICFQYDLPKPQFHKIECKLFKEDYSHQYPKIAINILKIVKQINGYSNEIIKLQGVLKFEETTLKIEEQNDHLEFVDYLFSSTTEICYQCKLKLENPVILRCQHSICQYCFEQCAPNCNICSKSQNEIHLLQQDFIDPRSFVTQEIPEKLITLINLIDKSVKQIVCTQFSSQIPIIYYYLSINKFKCRYYQNQNDLELFKGGDFNVFIMPENQLNLLKNYSQWSQQLMLIPLRKQSLKQAVLDNTGILKYISCCSLIHWNQNITMRINDIQQIFKRPQSVLGKKALRTRTINNLNYLQKISFQLEETHQCYQIQFLKQKVKSSRSAFNIINKQNDDHVIRLIHYVDS
ncbi:hypothetical protein pb186bvf_009316 [Paramecium bursaria]